MDTVTPVREFKSVWLKNEEGSTKSIGAAWDDRGRLKVFADHVEYHGKAQAFSLWHIRDVQVGKFGDNPFHKWVKVRFIHEGVVGVALFSGKGKVRGENDQLARSLRALVTPSSGPDEDVVTREYLELQRPERAKRYAKVMMWGAINIAIAVVLVFMDLGSRQPWTIGIGALLLILGTFMLVDGWRGRARSRRDDG